MAQIPLLTPVTLPLSLEDFLALPETKPPREFVEGTILEKTMPQGKHSTLQSELVPMINNALRGRKIARAFAELGCTFGGRSLVPDVSVFVRTVFIYYPNRALAILDQSENVLPMPPFAQS